MAFMTLFMVALMPVLKTLLLSAVGLFLATKRVNLLGHDARRSINNMVFYVFSPCLMAAYLAQTVTLDIMIDMWFMPVNILITFIIGFILGWILVKITRAPHSIKGLIIGCCGAGNLGNLLLIIIPAICTEPKSPFGQTSVCIADGAALVSVSMAVGAMYIWSFVYVIMKKSADHTIHRRSIESAHHTVVDVTTPSNHVSDDSTTAPLLISEIRPAAVKTSSIVQVGDEPKLGKLRMFVRNIFSKIGTLEIQHLLAPSTVGSIIGFIIGVVPLLKHMLIGNSAPFRVVYSTAEILGGATVPCVALIVGANLMRGLRRSGVSVTMVLGVLFVRYVALPLLGMVVVRGAVHFGLVGSAPLYQFVLMLHFALPPAMTIGTISQLFETGEAECSVIMLWTYLVSALALTFWSTVFMSLVS